MIQSPYEMASISNKQLKFLLDSNAYRRQDYKKNFIHRWSIYIANKKFLQKYNTFVNKHSYPFILKSKYRIDIDDIEDFDIAQKIYSKK